MENSENPTTEVEKVEIREQNEPSSELKEPKVEKILPVCKKRSHSPDPPDPDSGDQIVAKRVKETDDRPIKAILVDENGLITSDQSEILRKYLFNCIVQDCFLEADVPRIESTILQAGVIKVSCLGQATFDWLLRVISKSEALWPGEKLRVLTSNQFKLFSAFIVRITLPGEILPHKTVFNLLSRQNPRIDISHWHFCSSKRCPRSTGQTISIRMDIHSVRELARDHRLLYGIGPVYAQLSYPAQRLKHYLPWRK